MQPEAEWVSEFLQQIDAQDRAAAEWCGTLDQNQVSGWIEELAGRADRASLWLQYQLAGSLPQMQEKLRAAAMAGFHEAQSELANVLGGGSPGWAGDTYSAQSVPELLRSAVELPWAKGALALCEYAGCGGSVPDVEAAVIDARGAAQAGSLGALIALGAHVPPGELDPDEVAAWKIVQALLEQDGCSNGTVSVDWMRTTTATLYLSGTTPSALVLAHQYWNQFSSQIMAAQGCGP